MNIADQIFQKGVEASKEIMKNIEQIGELMFPGETKKSVSLQVKILRVAIKESQKDIKSLKPRK